MAIRNGLLLCSLIMLSAANAPALAAVDVGIVIGVPPPVARFEVVPAPRAGFVWAPGYWRWDGYGYVWVDGHWMEHRRGHYWVPERWERRGGRHRFHPGHWEREGHRQHERGRRG